MKHIEIEVAVPNGDIESTEVRWYDPDAVFLMQHETNTGIKHTVLLEKSEASQVRDALSEFLAQS